MQTAIATNTPLRGKRVRLARQALRELSDDQLVSLCLQGNELAWDTIINRWQKKLTRFIDFRINNLARSEEICQEAFIKVFKHLDRYDPKLGRFSTWLCKIAKNLVGNTVRYQKRRPDLVSSIDLKKIDKDQRLQLCDTKPLPDAVLDNKIKALVIRKAISRLTKDHQKAITLFEFEDRTYAEIAIITKVLVGTVRSRIHRARGNFRRIIEPMLD